jgi:MFS superfamily sulfate permease-like transporter
VIATNLLTGVLVGLGLSLVEVLPYLHRVWLRIRLHETAPGEVEIHLAGAATFLQLPRLLRALETAPRGEVVRLDLRRLRRVDHTCVETIADWLGRVSSSGTRVEIDPLSAERHGLVEWVGVRPSQVTA